MKLSAVIPTINGREPLLDQTIQSLAETANGTEVELIVVRNAPTIGQAWNEGAAEATGSHLWLGADDVTFGEGWIEAAEAAVAHAGYPCPRIIRPDGSVEACGTLGQGGLYEAEMEDRVPCGASPFPFMELEDWQTIGPSLPIGYYADDYLGFKARLAGRDVYLVRDYTLVHYEGTVGRGRIVARAMQDRATFLSTITEENRCLVPS